MKRQQMTGNENELNAYLGGVIIARLLLQDDQIFLKYTQDWQKSGYAISPHLLLSDEIPTVNIQRYLRNLFPEGEVLDTLLTNLHLSKANTFGIIRTLGADTSGSLLFLPSGQSVPTSSSFRVITSAEVERRLDERDEYSLIIWDGKPRLSMAGVQDKINVSINTDDQMGFGEGKLISTHILKFEKQKLSHLVINEYVTMQLARQCGMQVANVELKRFGKYPTLLIERFDRKLISSNEVMRRHVIDGCQALNLPPEYKYERNFGSGRDVAHIRDGASLAKLFDFANKCTNPAETKSKMLDWVLFNLLIYNYDAHGKNISFFVGKHGMSLTPFYDLVNIKMYPQFENEMAMVLGDDFDGETIRAYQLADFADNCQLSRPYLVKQLKNMAPTLLLALDKNNIFDVACNEQEKHYLEQYQQMVRKRCEYFLEQADEIMSVKL
ncbi:MAG: HipA protein [Gammaproteobacteria bacterium RIFCSPHIGHO2_12_FULL_43_28]|nr:MAG: HipA protein [Gammaproteobacteria bacterium RIFCSPHIGHO2_12_FULL_43_28]